MTGRRLFGRATVTLFVASIAWPGFAAQGGPDPAPDTKAADTKSAAPTPAPKEESSATDHTIRLGGQMIRYRAVASTTLLKDDKGEATALIYSTAYTRTDAGDASARPIVFLYNGGPGSASVWLHMGAFGPRRVVTGDGAATPPAPYRVVDNEACLLDRADLVFIDPVGTGFSHAVGKAQNKDFWGVDEDVRSLAQFITTYVNRNGRWNSPKFLIGESYGTFRSVALARYLDRTDGMAVNGIILMSSVLDFSTIDEAAGDDRPYMLFLPTYAAVAWYFNVVPDRPADLQTFLTAARTFAETDYAAALLKGSALGDAGKSAVAKTLARFTGLSEDYLVKANLRVLPSQFRAELERAHGLTIGRYDGRFAGPTGDLLTETADFDPSFSAVAGAFTAAFNVYARDELKFAQDRPYLVLPAEPGHSWNWKHDAADGFPVVPNVGPDLVRELTENPRLAVEIENGVFDLATPFLATEYTIDHLLLAPALRERVHLQYYTAGHMMYLHDDDRAKLKANVDAFIDGVDR